MTDILTRLTNQAAGRSSSRLRTKTPSRFEAAGFETTGFETADLGETEAFTTANSDAPNPPPPGIEGRRTSGMRTNKAPDVPQSQQHSDHTSDIHLPPAPLLTPQPSLSTTNPVALPTQTVQPEPEMRSRERSTPARGLEPVTTQPSQPKVDHTIETTVTPVQPHSTEPPAPLLPPEPQKPINFDTQTTREPASQPQNRAMASHTAPPEITIHIGRIELRTDAAKSEKRPHKRPKPDVASLSDYLKGGRA